jgi:hypothetical protein
MNKWEKYEMMKKGVVAKDSNDYEAQIKRLIMLLKI